MGPVTNTVKQAVAGIADSFWSDLRASSRNRGSWCHSREWWHNKLYEYNDPNRGDQEQTVLGRTDVEIPWF